MRLLTSLNQLYYARTLVVFKRRNQLSLSFSRELQNNNLTGTIPSQIRALPLFSLHLASNPLCYYVDYGNWVPGNDYPRSDCLNCPNPCENGGDCYNGVFTFTCSCPVDFTGATCQLDENTCRSSPCQHGGGNLHQRNQWIYLRLRWDGLWRHSV